MTITKTKKLSKAAKVEQLLSRTKGASIEEISKATNWKPHSVRAFLSGLRKKGLEIARELRGDKITAYRITAKPASEIVSS